MRALIPLLILIPTATVAGANTHTFSTPFAWNGLSNIIVQICHEVTTPSGSSTVSADANSGKTTGFISFSAGSQCGAATGSTQAPELWLPPGHQ